MNAIFQALAYVPSVREYSEKYYLKEQRSNEKTKKVVDLFRGMYTGKYNVMLEGGIVNEFENSYINPLTFLETELRLKLSEVFFKGFYIVKVSLQGKQYNECGNNILVA